MSSPRDSNLERLLAESLMGWRASPEGWVDRDGKARKGFAPLTNRDDTTLIIRRMYELGFTFEDRRIPVDDADNAIVASFHRGREVFSALAETEGTAISTAAMRFVMHRAGSSIPVTEELKAKMAGEVSRR